MNMKNIAGRILAVFGYSAAGVMVGGAIFGVEIWKAALISACGATAQVIEKLARAYADDGKISKAELDDAFSTAKGGKK